MSPLFRENRFVGGMALCPQCLHMTQDVSCHSWTSLYAFLLSIILTLTDPLDPAKTHWLITFHHLFSIKPYRVQIKFENRNYAELKLPSFQLTWSKHWSTWFPGHQGIQRLIKAPPSTLPLIDSESEYSCCCDRLKKKKKWQHSGDAVLHRTTECERRRRIIVQPGHSDILKTLRKNLQREASCCFSPFSAAAAENAASAQPFQRLPDFFFFFSLQGCIDGSYSRS